MADPRIIDTRQTKWTFMPTRMTGKIYGQIWLASNEDTGINIIQSKYPADFTTVSHTHPCAHGLFITNGQMKINGKYYGKDTLVWFPEGCIAEHGSAEYIPSEAILISNKEFDMNYLTDGRTWQDNSKELEPIVSDVNKLLWKPHPSDSNVLSKTLLRDPDTGMQIDYVRCSQDYYFTRELTADLGIYILSGQFVMNGESFGPETFLWYKKGDKAVYSANRIDEVVYLQVLRKVTA